ncbi:MAG: hypothetical protein A2W01_00905 [Candidatus Solincola sediminis]|nr:MAG: hypothetical protein A2W01_00905 [Candidatus Solincola sediminis]
MWQGKSASARHYGQESSLPTWAFSETSGQCLKEIVASLKTTILIIVHERPDMWGRRPFGLLFRRVKPGGSAKGPFTGGLTARKRAVYG